MFKVSGMAEESNAWPYLLQLILRPRFDSWISPLQTRRTNHLNNGNWYEWNLLECLKIKCPIPFSCRRKVYHNSYFFVGYLITQFHFFKRHISGHCKMLGFFGRWVHEYEALVKWYWQEINEKLWEKAAAGLLCSSQVLLAWNWTQTSAVKGRRLVSWIIQRQLLRLSKLNSRIVKNGSREGLLKEVSWPI